VVLEAVIIDGAADLAPMNDRRAVVDATPHPRLFDLLTRLRKAVIGARHFNRRIGQTEADLIPEEFLQDARRCTRVKGVTAVSHAPGTSRFLLSTMCDINAPERPFQFPDRLLHAASA
jgi:hypothetical protein